MMQPHTELIALAELRRAEILAEASHGPSGDGREGRAGTGLRARLAAALVQVALCLDRRATAAGVAAAQAHPRTLAVHL